MKVFLNYQDNVDETRHKTLKITLPKSWKSGTTNKLLVQFVESYNSNNSDNLLDADLMHLEISHLESRKELASDDVIESVLEDRQDVFVMHGASKLRSELDVLNPVSPPPPPSKSELAACTHFGCRNRFPKGGPYPANCVYHKSPLIFHETAKYWSCCPHKKAYDWDTFEAIPGCHTGTCTDVKESTQKTFLGGCDVRDALGGGGEPALRSIDDFNREQSPTRTLEVLRETLAQMEVENELLFK